MWVNRTGFGGDSSKKREKRRWVVTPSHAGFLSITHNVKTKTSAPYYLTPTICGLDIVQN